MTAAFFSKCLPATDIRPLVIASPRQTWRLTPWFEPVWRADGRLMALEMLSRPADAVTGIPVVPGDFFSRASLPVMLDVFRWQLAVLKLLSAWGASRRLSVSLNLTRALAKRLLNEPDLQHAIRALAPRVRLEISEHFIPDGAEPRQDTLLPALRELAPLWLDDYGAGTTARSWLVCGRFEYVKIDRHVFQTLARHPGGGSILRDICTRSAEGGAQVMAEGVCSEALHAFACNNGVAACQGWLWPGSTAEQLQVLPLRIAEPVSDALIFTEKREAV